MFGTSGIRGQVGADVSADLGVSLGRALASWGVERCVLGRDPRPSGRYLSRAVSCGLCESGVDVINIGLAATPTIARAVAWRDADAGIAVTASHNPPTDNGFKLWHPTGQSFRPAEQTRLATLIDEASPASAQWDAVGQQSEWKRAADKHVDALTRAVSLDDPLDVVVDVGNGAGQVTARALDSLGCHVRTLNGQPDGRFPGRPSEPSAEHCRDLCALVSAIDADVGIAHDGDADRMRAVDEKGTFPTGDALLALLACDTVEAGDAVAAPINTSLAVDEALEEHGASLRRTPVGDVHVAEECRSDDVVFGGEPSGAWIWPDETLCPDGPLAACKLVELVAKRGSLASLLADIPTYPIRRRAIEINATSDLMERVIARLREEFHEVETMDGARVEVDGGWFLIRPSGTEPVVRVTAEANDPSRAEELLERGTTIVERSRD